jgi:hypothetical protein
MPLISPQQKQHQRGQFFGSDGLLLSLNATAHEIGLRIAVPPEQVCGFVRTFQLRLVTGLDVGERERVDE